MEMAAVGILFLAPVTIRLKLEILLVNKQSKISQSFLEMFSQGSSDNFDLIFHLIYF